MPSQAVEQLLEQGQRSGLFSSAEAQDLIAQMSADKALTCAECAAQMIAKKVLTPYQAEQLLAGRLDECLIAGRYRILDKLGEGGMGVVYKAHDTQLDRDVAVKVLPAQSLYDADAIARFQREARALAKLSHPNIIQAYDSGEDKGRHFLVMEYVEGASLSAILREQGAIPPTLAADMIYQAALGLQHAHEKGLVHRDLKPANLLLSPARPLAGRLPQVAKDQARASPELTTTYLAPAALNQGIVKILDLGLARFLQDQLGNSQVTQEGIGVGTPDYMAPEQFRDAHHADVRTDIYGLGCSLYQLISGTVPFPGSSWSEKADAHAKKEPIPLEERCPEMPAGLAFVVSKMMAKHPTDRFQTAVEVAEALAPYVAGASNSATLLRQTMRFRAGQLTIGPPNRRKRLLVGAGAGIVTACFVALLYLAWARIFSLSAPESKTDSQAQTTEPGTPTSEPPTPKVVTIENGLTVAKDGTGQYTTIGEALEEVKPGQTIRVLDAGSYRETIRLAQASRFAQITIEAPRAATLSPTDDSNTVVVIDVPGVTIRGLKIRGPGRGAAVGVAGKCPGTTLEQLHIDSNFGIVVLGVGGRDEDPPALIQDCTLKVHGEQGIRVSGIQDDMKSPRLCRRVVVRGNHIQGARYGVVIHGQAQQVQIVGNRISGSESSAIALANLLPGTQDLLIANNTLWENHNCFTLFDDAKKQLPRVGIQVKYNLVVKSQSPDFAFFDGVDPDNLKGEGDGASLHALWQFSHNWREGKALAPNEEMGRAWIPPSSTDELRERIDLLSTDPKDPHFLQPAKDSPLATGGAGGDLPAYVGAVPPEGVALWDWDRTWKAQKVAQKDGKTGKD
jgi:serine/threonine protein kinase